MKPVLQPSEQNTSGLKQVRRPWNGVKENLSGAASKSSNVMIAPLHSAWFEMLANTEVGYAAVVEGVEEFLYREELQADDHADRFVSGILRA